eukprot:2206121-Alexandrium_andersonii.AAC.1
MSASLVGSEMCIRDRSWPGQCELALPGMRARRQRTRGLSSSRAARILCPVSYTHLTLPTICSV